LIQLAVFSETQKEWKLILLRSLNLFLAVCFKEGQAKTDIIQIEVFWLRNPLNRCF